MTPQQLAQKLSLSHRAIALSGTLEERMKKASAGMISGYCPHYTVTGCPTVQFNTEGLLLPMEPNAAAIEATFVEEPQGDAAAKIMQGYGRALNMVHLQMGRAGIEPNAAEASVLREAGEIFRRHSGKPVLLAVLPVCSAAPYGVSQARLCPLGLFNLDGQPLWLHPIAVGSLLKADYPDAQTQRSLVPKPTTPAPAVAVAPAVPEPHWYERMQEVWKAKKPKAMPGELHELIVERRADRLMDDGEVKTKAEGLAIARKEAAAYRATQQPPAAPLRTSTGPAEPSAAKAPAAKLTAARIKP